MIPMTIVMCKQITYPSCCGQYFICKNYEVFQNVVLHELGEKVHACLFLEMFFFWEDTP